MSKKPSERINSEFPRRRINGMYDGDSGLHIMLELILEELDESQEQLKALDKEV